MTPCGCQKLHRRRRIVLTRRASPRAIFYVQRELDLAADTENLAIVLCDRGTVDGSAYWPGPDDFWAALGTTLDDQLRRYDAVIMCGRPRWARVTITGIRSVSNRLPKRRQSTIGSRPSWAAHPRRFEVASTSHFLDKAGAVLEILCAELPECRRYHGSKMCAPTETEDAGRHATAR